MNFMRNVKKSRELWKAVHFYTSTHNTDKLVETCENLIKQQQEHPLADYFGFMFS